MKPAYRLSARAKDHLDRIIEESRDTWGRAQAAAMARELRQSMRMLAENPDLGRERTDLGVSSRYRFWTVKRLFIVMYEPKSRPLHVLAIFDGRRDLQRVIRKRSQ